MKNELESNEQIQQPQEKTGIRTLNSEDGHAVWVTDGDERFVVPRRYAAKICAAVPGLRFSFEHLGGKHVGHPVPARMEQEISFESIGGKKVGQFRLEERDAPQGKDGKE